MPEQKKSIHDWIDLGVEWLLTHLKQVIGGAALVALVLLSILMGTLHYGSFTNAGTCALCHETRYDYEDYRPHPAFDSVGGLNVGCAECHPQNYYEYTKSAHYRGLNGINPGCVTCHGETHSPADFVRFMFGAGPWFWSEAGSGPGGEFWDISSPVADLTRGEKFRPRLAEKVRQKFRDSNSAACLQCHDPDLLAASNSIEAVAKVHTQAKQAGASCIECHQSVVHAPPILERKSLVADADLNAGREVFAENCAGCHGDTGQAVTPGVPSFAWNERLYKPDATLLTVIKQGKSDAMPGFGEYLSDQDVRSVLAYARSLSRIGPHYYPAKTTGMAAAGHIQTASAGIEGAEPQRLAGDGSTIPAAAEACTACHYLDRDKKKVGPSLFNKAGGKVTIKGLPFDRWTDKNLDTFLTDPRALKPGTQMAFGGIKNAEDRAAVIAFLKTLK